MRLQVENIVCLQYNNDDGFKTSIPTWYQAYIRIFKGYCSYKHKNTSPLYNNWMSLTKNEFDLWTKRNFPDFKRPEISLSSCPSSTQEVPNLQYEREALHYILEDVLELDSNSQITKTIISLGTTTVSELLQITFEDIINLQYSHGNSDMTKIQYLTTIDCFQGYISYRKEYNYHADQSWFSITATDIDDYAMTDHYSNYTNRYISNSVQCTQHNCMTATPSGKCLYPDTTYQSMPLDKPQSNTIYQTTAQVYDVDNDSNVEHKSNGIKVTDISTYFFSIHFVG